MKNLEDLLNLLLKKPKMKCDIKIQLDDEKEKAITEVDGNLPSILTAIAMLVSNLRESKVPKELIRGAVEIGFDEDTKKENKKVIEKEIIIDNEEKAKKIKKFLEELEEN